MRELIGARGGSNRGCFFCPYNSVPLLYDSFKITDRLRTTSSEMWFFIANKFQAYKYVYCTFITCSLSSAKVLWYSSMLIEGNYVGSRQI